MEHLCAKCGRSMVDPVTGTRIIGFRLAAEGTDAAAWQRVYPDLPFPFALEVCVGCVANLYGVDVHA